MWILPVRKKPDSAPEKIIILQNDEKTVLKCKENELLLSQQ